MAMLNNQMVYNFSFSHLGNCGTGVDFILATFPWQLGFLDSHSLTNFSWWNPTWVAALRPFQSTVVFATQKTTKFSRGLRGFWWFSDGFLVPFPSIFRGFCAFSFHSLPVKSPPFSVFRKGIEPPGEGQRSLQGLQRKRFAGGGTSPEPTTGGCFLRGWFSCWGLPSGND